MLAASIFHYSQHTVGEAKALLAERGIRCACDRRRQASAAATRGPHRRQAMEAHAHRRPRPAGPAPTPDRGAQTLFNWLGQDLTGWRCLDAFAGTGALGFETASRNASGSRAAGRDATRRHWRTLLATRERLGAQERVRVERTDALAWMARAGDALFDLVFLDPPFPRPGSSTPRSPPPLHRCPPGIRLPGGGCRWPTDRLARLGLRLRRRISRRGGAPT